MSATDFSSAKKVAVIGAGPAGLAAAYRLQLAGVQVDLYESQPSVGGFCRSFELWGHTVDLGPHRFFSSNEKVNQFWFSAAGKEFAWVPRQTRIFYNQRYFEYPLRILSTFRLLGLWESFRCLLSYFVAVIFASKKDEHFENWVVRRFGRRLYEIFFKTYTEKLWGLPCHDIDPDFAYRKIRKLSFFEVSKRFFKKKDTFVDTFAYPHQGTGAVYEKIAQRFIKKGGNLKLNTPMEALRVDQDQFYLTSQSQTAVYDHVISTMPLTQLIRQLPSVPESILQTARSLSFRHTILVYLYVEEKNIFSDNWIYVHAPNIRFGRVTNFNNWSPSSSSTAEGTVLCLEYWCSTNDEMWRWTDSQLGEFAKKEWREAKISSRSTIKDFHVIKLANTYPVFRLGYKAQVEQIKNYLQTTYPHLCTIGRYGAFKYNNQDHSLLMGLRAAEQYLFQQKDNTADVNASQIYDEDFELKDIVYDTFDEV
ncbi:FAD-dependent oxidoreductase [bacterium]|nr:FAD-dependent oxidoreductase [bacterium]